jgi:hypothetical protein
MAKQRQAIKIEYEVKESNLIPLKPAKRAKSTLTKSTAKLTLKKTEEPKNW